MATTNSVQGGTPRDELPWNLANPTLWHKSAPKELRKAAASDGKWGGWEFWAKHLAKRKGPASLKKLLPGKGRPLLWAMADGDDTPELPAEGKRGRRRTHKGPSRPAAEKEVLRWLSEAAGRGPQVRYSIEAVAWAHALPELALCVAPEVWWDLLGHLVATSIEAAEVSLEESPLPHQLLAGELAAALAYQLPEIAACRKLKASSRRALSAGLVDLTDGHGFLHARHLDRLEALLACWTRCRAMAEQSGRKAWTKVAERQYGWLVRTALRLARSDGSTAFSPTSPAAGEVLRAAVKLGGGKNDRKIAAWNAPGRKKGGRKPASTLSLPDASVHSEWAAAAVLRRTWQPRSERLSVAYPGREVRIELAAGPETFFSGVWELEVSSGGRPAQPVDDWQEVCWFSDNDVDYLELQTDLTGGLRVQRHMLLAREERFLLLADSILSSELSGIDYRSRLPLCSGVRFQPAEETREGLLVSGKRRALVLPLALPEWRIDPRVGDLAQSDAGLELWQSTDRQGLMAPLFVDLAPHRATRPRTWRQLTVAETLEPVAPDVAVGYRAAVGHAQWLIYRSIGPRGNRSVLGQNFSNEMIVGRFRRSGETEVLLHIE